MATGNWKLVIEPKAKQLVAKLMRNLAVRGRGSEVFWQLLWLPETVAKPSTLFAACGRFISFSASATAAAFQFRLCGLTWRRVLEIREPNRISWEWNLPLSLSLRAYECVRWVAGLPPVIKNYSQQIQKRLLFIAMIQRCPPQSVWLWLSNASLPVCLVYCLVVAVQLN